jgi:Lrp/AsnC family leucine-responsive transcriptional regulator
MAFTQNPVPAHLDDMDLKILKLLCQDSKTSFADLGKAVHLTAPAVHARVKKLEKLGVIKNYTVEIDYDRIGLPVIAFVQVQVPPKARCKEASKKLAEFVEVVECHAVAGEVDMVIKTRTTTPLELHHLLDRMKSQGLIEKSTSLLVLESYFSRSRL